MLHGACGYRADTVERTLRDITQNQRPFGGKTIVWMGDFKQLLPVVRYGKGQNHTIQQFAWWRSATKLKFSKNWRAAQNAAFTSFLEDVGNGRVDRVTSPAECRCSSYNEIIQQVYGDQFDNRHQILALTLDTCAEINRMCFAKLPGDMVEFPAADHYVDCSDRDAFPPDYVQSLAIKGAPPWMLQFKPGAKYMCIRSLNKKIYCCAIRKKTRITRSKICVEPHRREMISPQPTQSRLTIRTT
jgi:ATP-dependent DNA helicase PIF1